MSSFAQNCSGLLPTYFIPSGMHRRICLLIVVLLVIPVLCGCVRRKMTIMSNPPGATVYLDGNDIGRTPLSTNFDHYGKREFRIVKQGYETKTELKSIRAPWYQWVGFDFVSEVLLPGKLTDHKAYEFDLQPERVASSSEIAARAEEFRQTAHADGVPHIGSAGLTVPTTNVGSTIYPIPDFAPIVPSATPFLPSGAPHPTTFVPPAIMNQ